MEKEQYDIKKVNRMINKIAKATERIESTNGNTISQKIIMVAFDMMTIAQLEDIYYLLSEKIKLKKYSKNKNDTSSIR